MGGNPLQLLVILLLGSFSLSAQPNVSASLDSSRILIGDQVQLHVYAEHSPGEQIQSADYSGLEQIPELEILKISPWDTLPSGEQFLLRQNLTLTSFDSGYYLIPPIPIHYLRQNGAEGTVNTNDLAISVETVFLPGDSLQLAPIKPIIEEPLKFSDFLPYLGIGLGVAAGILVALFLMRRKPKKEIVEAPLIIRPPHEIALDKLATLKAKKLWQQGKVKEYHSELTYIIREYLEARFRTPALESTTSEIMQSLGRNAMDEDLFNRLRELLQVADLVKFAKAQPSPDIHDRALAEAERFIEQTKEKPPAAEELAATENGQEHELSEPRKPENKETDH